MIGIDEGKSTPPAAAAAATDTVGSTKLHCRWSHLPRDLQWQIVKLLPIEDYFQFFTVCKSWHSTAAERRHPPAEMQRLRLILSIDDTHWSLRRPDRSKGRTSSLHPLPEKLKGGHPLSCSRGWVAIVNFRKSFFLFNPLTGTIIILPKPDSPGKTFLRKLTLSASAACKDCIVAVKLKSGTFNGVVVCRPGDDRWTPLLETDDSPEERVCDMAFCGGVLYIIYGCHGALLAATFGRNETISFSMAELGRYSFLPLYQLGDLQERRLVALRPGHVKKPLVFDDSKKESVDLKRQVVCILTTGSKHDPICVPAAATRCYDCNEREHGKWIKISPDYYLQIHDCFNIKSESLIKTDTGFAVWFSPSFDTC